MRVFLTGGTGLIGRRLIQRLNERGDVPVVLSRRADKARLRPSFRGVEIIQGDPNVAGAWDAALDGCDAVINLVGHNIFAQRWNDDVKKTLRDSRVHATENLVEAIRMSSRRPQALIQASAIGYYGPHGDEELTESSPPGTDFMADLCRDWEAAAAPVEDRGVRLATVRVGVVLARDEGALGVMAPIFKYLPGGAAPVGSQGKFKPARGRQWLSWIHLDDIAGLFLLALDRADARGPINGTAPQPVRNAEFARTLARALRGGSFWPPFLPVGPPDAVLWLALGEVADVVTKGQKVLPSWALELGYAFQFPDLAGALNDLFPPPAPRSEPVAAQRAGA